MLTFLAANPNATAAAGALTASGTVFATSDIFTADAFAEELPNSQLPTP